MTTHAVKFLCINLELERAIADEDEDIFFMTITLHKLLDDFRRCCSRLFDNRQRVTERRYQKTFRFRHSAR